jgi:hypothetical protein
MHDVDDEFGVVDDVDNIDDNGDNVGNVEVDSDDHDML